MIKDFTAIESLNGKSNFQSTILNEIKSLTSEVNFAMLSEYSYVDVNDKHISISLVHLKDADTIITINVFRDRISFWYSSCDIVFENDETFDIVYFKKFYQKCLLGDYFTDDFYYKGKHLLSVTNLLGQRCTIPFSMLYKFYFFLFEKQITMKRVSYCSFCD
jgi:hypothetical protein